MKYIPNAVSRKVFKTGLILKKKSPTLLFTAGLVGVVATTVLASRATLKLTEIVDDTQNEIDMAEKSGNTENEVIKAWTIGAGRVARLYTPAIIVGTASIACLTGSHYILTQRNNQLTAAYVALDRAYSSYRQRVEEKYGDDAVNEYADVLDEKGNLLHKRLVTTAAHPYARLFDEINSKAWQGEEGYNLTFIRQQQNWANDMLHARGYIMLNDVYSMLGLSHTAAGALVGWMYGHGENTVDFGLDSDTEVMRAFRAGYEPNAWLDFNVHGEIWQHLGKGISR